MKVFKPAILWRIKWLVYSQKWAITVNDSDDDFEPPSKKVKLQLREEKIDIPAYIRICNF